MSKRLAAFAAMTLFVLAGAPAVGQPSSIAAPSSAFGDPCFDGCMLNCLKTGDLLICEDTCFEVTCPAVVAPKMSRVDGL